MVAAYDSPSAHTMEALALLYIIGAIQLPAPSSWLTLPQRPPHSMTPISFRIQELVLSIHKSVIGSLGATTCGIGTAGNA